MKRKEIEKIMDKVGFYSNLTSNLCIPRISSVMPEKYGITIVLYGNIQLKNGSFSDKLRKICEISYFTDTAHKEFYQ